MSNRFPIYVFLENIRSLYNVGSFFRTCDATNIEKLFLCGYTPKPPRKEISKTALGAEMHISWEYVPKIDKKLLELKRKGFQIICVETGKKSIKYTTFQPNFPICVVFGNEVGGISKGIQEIADQIISIPMHGIKASLNVSVAGGVVLYDLVNKYKV